MATAKILPATKAAKELKNNCVVAKKIVYAWATVISSNILKGVTCHLHAHADGEKTVARRISQKLCAKLQSAESLLCKRWTTLIVEVLLRQPRRFNELLADLEVVSDRMLSERLKELEHAGVVLRRVLPDTPLRVEYSLTPKGQDLAPIIEAIRKWSEQHRDDATTPPSPQPQALGSLPVVQPLQSLGVWPKPSLSTSGT